MTTSVIDSDISENDTISTLSDAIYEIADHEEEYIDCEKRHGKYYLGSYVHNRETNTIQLSTAISADALFKYDIRAIQLYLEEYDMYGPTVTVSSVHIMQLDITPDGQYCAIIKTGWLTLIQRAWKVRFEKRKRAIRMRGSIQSQYYFMINGVYPQGLTHIPGIRGLLGQLLAMDNAE